MFAVDLHTHTRFFHGLTGRPTVYDPFGGRLLARSARKRHLDGIALTNHDYFQGVDSAPPPRLIPGIEVSTTKGHVLIIGPDPPVRTDPDELTPREVVSVAHDRDCVAVVPHPFRDNRILESAAPFDAIEVNGKHPHRQGMVRDLARERDLPVVGGSDAHLPFEVGRVYTAVDCDALTPESIVEAIRDDRVEPRIEGGISNRILQTGYTYLHRLKGRAPPSSE